MYLFRQRYCKKKFLPKGSSWLFFNSLCRWRGNEQLFKVGLVVQKKNQFLSNVTFLYSGKNPGSTHFRFPSGCWNSLVPIFVNVFNKISKITQKNRQNTLKDFPGQKVVLSEQLLKHGILKFAENRKETFFCKSINTRYIFQNCVSACLRVSICFPVRLWCLWFLWSLTWD